MLALALGGRPAASFSRRLCIPVSNDTLLRVLRKRGSPSFPPPSIIGIDDWAWRRNQRYGTLICDLERRKTIALLPDREPATAERWSANGPKHGAIEILRQIYVAGIAELDALARQRFGVDFITRRTSPG